MKHGGSHDFVRTGPSTIAGRYLRHFWHPIYVSAELKTSQLVPIHVMSEEFVLYRGASGVTRLMDARCPHRLTSLVAGCVEDDCVRCSYHGWKFDENGACIEQPAEMRPFCHKVRVATYPTREYLGLVFAYLGTDTPPPFAVWPELEEKPYHRASRAVLPCNYFQSAENIVDDVHVAWAHKHAPGLGASPRGADTLKVEAAEREFGLIVEVQHPISRVYINYVMPNSCYVEFWRRDVSGELNSFRVVFWYVPIDDEHHYHVRIDAGVVPLERDGTVCVSEEIHEILAGRSIVHRNPPTQHPPRELVRIQDGVSVVGQGSIAERRFERLGASDAGIILLRKIWLRELRALAEQRPVTHFTRTVHMEPGEIDLAPVSSHV